MKIALAQLNPIIGDLHGNAANILAAAQTAVGQGVSLLITPELSLCGYPPRDLLMDRNFVKDMAIALEQLAQLLPSTIAVLVGTVEFNTNAHHAGGKPLFNSAALLHHGKVQQVFHKRLLPTYDVFDEDRYFEPGASSNFFTLQIHAIAPKASVASHALRIGVTICEDIWNDERFWGKRSYADNPVADLAEQEVDLLLNLSASPYAVGKQKLREAMLKHSAIAHKLPLIYVNQVGANDDLIFDGSSLALNAKGECVANARAFDTDLVTVEFDIATMDLVPSESFGNGLANSLSTESPVAPPFVAPPKCEDEEIWEALVLGVRDYVRKCGFKKVAIGLSGGIDSALVAAIATAAIGKENVLGVLMPSPYSSDHSITDALELAQNLGIETHTIPIQAMMSAFDQSLADLFEGTDSGIAEENLQSRIRGSLLMAIANKFGHLLLSTGNKSEMSVGYCTLYGDMNGGLAAIADVPKTRVYSICEWLNLRSQELEDNSYHVPIIPVHILTKPPSAELKPDQVDRDSLPPYDILDDILKRLIGDRASIADIIAAGHEPATVERIVQLLRRAEFKRRQAAPGLKITDRAFGSGWRMPIASKISSP
ncbi:NAD+ synthase [Tumidithrix helvetica PCC 7403]|uniref:NAD+ synthase n=1 Tax=Tumidithrix helvetica TaxID=3457545 RepID=UPI003C8CEA65